MKHGNVIIDFSVSNSNRGCDQLCEVALYFVHFIIFKCDF